MEENNFNERVKDVGSQVASYAENGVKSIARFFGRAVSSVEDIGSGLISSIKKTDVEELEKQITRDLNLRYRELGITVLPFLLKNKGFGDKKINELIDEIKGLKKYLIELHEVEEDLNEDESEKEKKPSVKPDSGTKVDKKPEVKSKVSFIREEPKKVEVEKKPEVKATVPLKREEPKKVEPVKKPAAKAPVPIKKEDPIKLPMKKEEPKKAKAEKSADKTPVPVKKDDPIKISIKKEEPKKAETGKKPAAKKSVVSRRITDLKKNSEQEKKTVNKVLKK